MMSYRTRFPAYLCDCFRRSRTLTVARASRLGVILFLLVLTALFYASKRKVWSRIDH